MQDTWQYDADGRQSVQPVDNTDSSPLSCYINPSQTVEQRGYDAENHVISDVCGYGDTTSIAAGCQSMVTGKMVQGIAHSTPGYTVNLGYGANGHVRLANLNGPTYSPHWDGDSVLFVTDSSGALQQINIEDLGAISYQSNPAHLTVFDRDYGGQEVAIHTSASTAMLYGGSGQWQWTVMPQHWGQTTGAFAQGVSGPPVQGCFPGCGTTGQKQLLSTNGIDWQMLFDSGRSDGYFIGGITVQGARAYDSTTQQWSTPDAYKGDVHDPMSQRSYMWNNNNPVAYSDPSGFLSVGDVAKSVWNAVAGDDIAVLRSNASVGAKILAVADLASNVGAPEKGAGEAVLKIAAKELAKHAIARAAEDAAAHGVAGAEVHLVEASEEHGATAYYDSGNGTLRGAQAHNSHGPNATHNYAHTQVGKYKPTTNNPFYMKTDRGSHRPIILRH